MSWPLQSKCGKGGVGEPWCSTNLAEVAGLARARAPWCHDWVQQRVAAHGTLEVCVRAGWALAQARPRASLHFSNTPMDRNQDPGTNPVWSDKRPVGVVRQHASTWLAETRRPRGEVSPTRTLSSSTHLLPRLCCRRRTVLNVKDVPLSSRVTAVLLVAVATRSQTVLTHRPGN